MFDAFLAEAAADEPDVDMLKDSGVITEEELVRRRQAKVRRLLKLYKMQFTRLRGVLRLKHRRLVREKQRRLEAPQRKEQQKEQQKEQEITLTPAQKEKAALKDKSALSYHAGKASKAIAEKAFAEKVVAQVEFFFFFFFFLSLLLSSSYHSRQCQVATPLAVLCAPFRLSSFVLLV